jgi:hypothetical protein
MKWLFFALAPCVSLLCGCGSKDAGAKASPPDSNLPHGSIVYTAPDGVSLIRLYPDEGFVSAVWQSSTSFGLTTVGPQGARDIFTVEGPIAQGYSPGIIASAGNAYYGVQGALHVVSLASAIDRVIGQPGSCAPMRADATTAFCANDGALLAFPLDGSPTQTGTPVVDVSPGKITDVIADATTVYVMSTGADGVSSHLWSAPRAGGSATALPDPTRQEWYYGAFRAPDPPDDANVYFDISGGIARLSKGSGTVSIVLDVADSTGASCFGDPNIVGPDIYFGCGGTVSKMPLTGGAKIDIVRGDGTSYMVVANDALYWVSAVTPDNTLKFVVESWPLQP